MYGSAVIFKDSRPEFVLTSVEDYFEISDDEKMFVRIESYSV